MTGDGGWGAVRCGGPRLRGGFGWNAGDSVGRGMDSGFRRNEVGGAGGSEGGLVFEEFVGVHYVGGVEGGFYGSHEVEAAIAQLSRQ